MCVCLFAVFLIYFGPLFSQVSNALSSQPTTMQMSMESMDMSGHDHAKMFSEQASNTPTSSAHISHHGHHGHGESANLLEACGYCSLLFHLNWIDAKTFELIPLTQSRYPNIVTVTISHKYNVPFTSILPRAPPVTLV
ncbi:DUF2946 domain-containing protein [Marinomonas rhizomae]|uniref:DUF2946 domain-containing protein n=1 Tax=Marinomonas rhizomae TaxID=491948 RepID=UPI002104341C|nr:DUF2946 domain-containing protein [Marinomonas rhizomae]